MVSSSDFRNLSRPPEQIDEVIWPHLEPTLYQESIDALEELTSNCTNAISHRTSFYVGAGISAFPPSRILLANDVLNRLFEYCRIFSPELEEFDFKPVDSIIEAVNEGQYVLMENTLQHLFEIVAPRPFHSGRVFDVPETPSRFNVNHVFLAKWLSLNKGTVITTNIDPLIEHAWQQEPHLRSEDLTVIKNPDDFDDWYTLVSQPNILWKLHGSADDPESWSITLSKVGFTIRDARALFLKHIISEHNVCFVGYRAADLDLFPIISQAHKDSGSSRSTKIFWVFYYQEGFRSLEDYVRQEPNISKLFSQNRNNISAIVTTAERFFSWLQVQVLGVLPNLPRGKIPLTDDDYEKWLQLDIQMAGTAGVNKLIGHVLRTLGQDIQSINVLNDTAERMTVRSAQLLQESAQTSWMTGNYSDAFHSLNRAYRLLQETDETQAKVWCKFGEISMSLEKPKHVGFHIWLLSLFRLMFLHREFKSLSRNASMNSSSMNLGVGLCIFHETRILHKVMGILCLTHSRLIKRLLLRRYWEAEIRILEERYLPSLLSIKMIKASLMVSDTPQKAVEEILSALEAAQVLNANVYGSIRSEAIQLAEEITDLNIKSHLLNSL